MARILVAVSTAWAAQRLIAPVADLAKRMSATVIVAHVSRPSGGQLREQEQTDGEQSVSTLADALAAQNVEVETLLTFADDIARAIVNTAIEREATLIVLGLTGRNIFSRLIAGNVPVELIRETKVPVLLIPPDWDKAF
ncbi:MAG: universal stress protein [Tepidisphaeraceae bacterium]